MKGKRKGFLLLFFILLISGAVKGQGLAQNEWLVPSSHQIIKVSNGHISVNTWKSEETALLLKTEVKNPQLAFSKSGTLALIYGKSHFSELYHLGEDTCYKLVSFPFQTYQASFGHSDEEVFLLHTGPKKKKQLSSYHIASGVFKPLRKVSPQANSLTVNSQGSLIAISHGTVIKIFDQNSLAVSKVFWETQKQSLFAFNPISPMQGASVNGSNIIEVRDLEKDSIIAEIEGHASAVKWLGYAPNGKYLGSWDEKGSFKVWDIENKKLVFQSKEVYNQPIFDHKGGVYWQEEQEWLYEPLSDFYETSEQDVSASLFFIKTVKKPVEFLPQPLTAYSPETGIMFGGMVSVFFRPSAQRQYQPYTLPSSLITSIGYAPAAKQMRIGLEWGQYTPKGWYFYNKIAYNLRERNFFFGVTNDAYKNDRHVFSMNSFALSGSVLKNIAKEWRLGVGYAFRNDKRHNMNDEEISFDVPGEAGGRLIGFGPIVQLDTRDDMIFPYKGSFVHIAFFDYGRGIKSGFQYSELILDYRKYISLPFMNRADVLALQGFVHAALGSEVPFYQLPYLGADRLLRGVMRNRFIGHQVAFVQAEFRSFIFQGDSRFGYVVFAGAGDSSGNFIKKYHHPDLKIVYGVGYRQQIVPKMRLDLRIDFSVTNKGNYGLFGGTGIAF